MAEARASRRHTPPHQRPVVQLLHGGGFAAAVCGARFVTQDVGEMRDVAEKRRRDVHVVM